MRTSLQITVFAILIALVVDCASVNYEKAEATSSSFQAAALSLDDALLPLSSVILSLDDMVTTPGEDITTQFQT